MDPVIALRQIAHGAVGQCCQKVGEAEVLVAGGVTDVLVTNEIAGANKLTEVLERHAKAAEVADRDIRVQRHGNAFSIDAVMHAPVPPATAWEVLTDFEHMPRYQSSLKSSQVLERSPQRVLVQQKGVARFGPFSNAFESVREMQLTPQRSIRAQQVSGSALKQMASLMTLEPEEGGTRLTYRADMEPETALPPLLGVPVSVKDTVEVAGMPTTDPRHRRGQTSTDRSRIPSCSHDAITALAIG